MASERARDPDRRDAERQQGQQDDEERRRRRYAEQQRLLELEQQRLVEEEGRRRKRERSPVVVGGLRKLEEPASKMQRTRVAAPTGPPSPKVQHRKPTSDQERFENYWQGKQRGILRDRSRFVIPNTVSLFATLHRRGPWRGN